MPSKCDLCGKTIKFGDNVSHSKRHTRRDWVPNVHPTTIEVAGEKQHVNACTRCLRTQHKIAK